MGVWECTCFLRFLLILRIINLKYWPINWQISLLFFNLLSVWLLMRWRIFLHESWTFYFLFNIILYLSLSFYHFWLNFSLLIFRTSSQCCGYEHFFSYTCCKYLLPPYVTICEIQPIHFFTYDFWVLFLT